MPRAGSVLVLLGEKPGNWWWEVAAHSSLYPASDLSISSVQEGLCLEGPAHWTGETGTLCPQDGCPG